MIPSGNASSCKSITTEGTTRSSITKGNQICYATGGATPRMSEKSGTSYSKHVPAWAQENNHLTHYKERNDTTMGCKNYVKFSEVLDQYVIDRAAIERDLTGERREAQLRYCETSCRFQNRSYGKDTTQLDKKVKYQMSHLDPEILRKIQSEVQHLYPGQRRHEIANFDQKVTGIIEDMYRTILGNGTRQLAIKRAYREAYPYLQAGTGEKFNAFDIQMPFDVLDQVRAFHIHPYQIRIYRLLIKIQDPMKSKLFNMEDLEESVRKTQEYYRSHMQECPALMIVTRSDSIALVRKHIRWFTDENEFVLHNIPRGCKYGTITTPDKTVYRILLSNHIHRHFCPKAVREDKAFIYTDWDKS